MSDGSRDAEDADDSGGSTSESGSAPVDDTANDDPFAELEDLDVEADPFDTPHESTVGDELFTEVDVDDLDEESVWAELGATEGDATDVAVGGSLPDFETAADEHIVPKRGYCEKCEHFSTPPEMRCTNPGTEIIELVDMEHFRVSNCPVVVQRRGLTPDDD